MQVAGIPWFLLIRALSEDARRAIEGRTKQDIDILAIRPADTVIHGN
jgi:hypothetical protein